MENLDDFMRKKFDADPSGDRFEFREEFWEQAQAMLEAEEKRRRKRRRWLLWWFFTGAIATAVAVYSSSGSSSGQSAVVQDIEEGGRSVGKNGVRAHEEGSESNFDSSEKTLSADSSFLKKNIENQFFEKEKSKLGSTVRSSTEAGQQKNSAQEMRRGSRRSLAKNPPAQQVEKDAADEEAAPEWREDSAPFAPAFPQQQEKPPGQALQMLPDSSPSPATANIDKNDEQIAPNVTSNDSNDFNNLNNSDDSNNPIFSLLPTLLNWLALPARPIDTPAAAPFVRKIEPVRDRPFRFGLNGATSLYQPPPDGKKIGATGGAFAEYRFRPGWWLGLGVQWRYLAGDTVAVETSEQLRHDFGFVRDEWSLDATGFHSLEMPLALRRQWGALSVEGGVSTGILLGVRGNLEQRRTTSLQAAPTVQSSQVWMDKSLYRRLHFAPFLGAEWRATKHLGLAVRGHYRPGSLLKPSDASTPGGGLWWLDTGMRWRF